MELIIEEKVLEKMGLEIIEIEDLVLIEKKTDQDKKIKIILIEFYY
jgi:hypothetical protein